MHVEELDLVNLFLVLPITKILTNISPNKIEQNKGGDNIVCLHVKQNEKLGVTDPQRRSTGFSHDKTINRSSITQIE